MKPTQSINITVNGKPQKSNGSHSVAQLLADMDVRTNAIAVEVNGSLLVRDNFDRVLIEGDQIEIVTLAGGG